MALQLFKIASTTVETPQASIDFTSIPQGYTDLMLVASSRSTSAAANANLLIRLNADSNTVYTDKYLQGSGSSATSGANSTAQNYGYIGVTNAANSTTVTFGNAEIYIPNYTSSNNKSISTDSVEEENATAAYSQLRATLWSNTAAVNQVTLYTSANFAAGSTATLYGVL